MDLFHLCTASFGIIILGLGANFELPISLSFEGVPRGLYSSTFFCGEPVGDLLLPLEEFTLSHNLLTIWVFLKYIVLLHLSLGSL